MKRAITLIMALLMVATSCFALSGCGRTDVKTIGDFRFRYKEGSVAAHLHDLSDTGKEKTTLVIPSHLPNGLPVTSMGGSGFFAGGVLGNIVSEKLEKIFIPSIITSIPDYSIQPSSPIVVVITRNDTLESQLTEFILYHEFPHFKTLVVDDMSYSKYIEFYFWSHGINNVVLDPIVRLEFCSKIENYLKQPNVEFYLNYETENPLFWFDYETGEYVQRHYEGTYVPTREGYTFAGWYTEPECINDWNFDIDKIPQFEQHSVAEAVGKYDPPEDIEFSVFKEDIIRMFQETADKQEKVRLYAKWEQS